MHYRDLPHNFRRNSNRILMPKPKNHRAGGFEAQTTWRNISAMPPACVTVVLDHSITKSSNTSAWLGQPPYWLGQHGHPLHMYTFLLMSPSVTHHAQSSSHLGPLFQTSRLSFTPSPSVRHVSTWASPCLSIVSMLCVCTPTQSRDKLHMHSSNG